MIAPGRPGHAWVGPRGRLHVRPGRGPVVAEREQDRIEKHGDRRIEWVSRTDADIDGFDFKVDSRVTHLRFVLEVNGESRPDWSRSDATTRARSAAPSASSCASEGADSPRDRLSARRTMRPLLPARG